MTANLIHNDMLRINQSKIKRLTSSLQCPQKYYLEEITKELERESSEAMLRGCYFEYKLWGTLPKGNPVVPVLPGGRKKGSISEPQKRIDQQVADFPGHMEKYGIKIIRTDYGVEVPFNRDISVFGTMDALVEFHGRPYIMDLKLTADVTSTFGDFAWGNFQTLKMIPGTDGVYIYSHEQTVEHGGTAMDLIQAHAYMYFMEKLTGKRFGFIYAVYDYKAKGPEHKIIEIPFDKDAREDFITRLGETRYKLDVFKELKYMPIASESECKKCKADCASRWKPDEDPGPAKKIETTLPVQAKDPVTDMFERSIEHEQKKAIPHLHDTHSPVPTAIFDDDDCPY